MPWICPTSKILLKMPCNIVYQHTSFKVIWFWSRGRGYLPPSVSCRALTTLTGFISMVIGWRVSGIAHLYMLHHPRVLLHQPAVGQWGICSGKEPAYSVGGWPITGEVRVVAAILARSTVSANCLLRHRLKYNAGRGLRWVRLRPPALFNDLTYIVT